MYDMSKDILRFSDQNATCFEATVQSIYYPSKKQKYKLFTIPQETRGSCKRAQTRRQLLQVLLVQATQPRLLGRFTLITVTRTTDRANEGVSMVAGRGHHPALSPTHMVALLLLRSSRCKIL